MEKKSAEDNVRQHPLSTQELDKQFSCRGCKMTMGYTNGKRIKIGDAIFFMTVTFNCVWCGHKNVWRPVAK